MYQLTPTESAPDAPTLADDRSACDGQALSPCYRSEAFAEDLFGSEPAAEPVPAAAPRRATALMLWAAPTVAALFGGALALFGATA
jgi:hypothetical protein